MADLRMAVVSVSKWMQNEEAFNLRQNLISIRYAQALLCSSCTPLLFLMPLLEFKWRLGVLFLLFKNESVSGEGRLTSP
jgi:hypothetical protein